LIYKNHERNPMKTFLNTLGLAAALALALFAGQVRAQDDSSVSFQTFYDQLASQGTWVQTDNYGYVFQPTENDPNWRPYTYGHWVDTDEGMAWVSDEPFGWATYHYGRWVNLDGYGWVWVPGYTWAPAWVSWRDGDDYVGWAPLPPDADVGIDFFTDNFDWGFGFHIGDDCDLAYGIGPAWYNFCPVAFIGDRDCWRHFRDRDDNFAFINHTRNVTNINFRRDGAGRFGHVHAEGPSVAAMNARARTPIGHAQLTSASRLGNAGLHGNTLAVFAPRIDPATVTTARPGSVNRTLANASVNRGTDINRPLTVNSRIGPTGPTAVQIHAATLAQGNVPANARIATANTRISRPLTQPLTSLRTDTRSTPTFGTGVRPNTVTGTTRVSAPSVSAGSRYTGEAVSPQAIMPSRTTSTFRGTPSYSSGESYHPSSVFHTSAPVYRSQTSAPVFHSSAPQYHPQSSAPVYHPSTPAYQPQSSFRSYAPAPQSHYGGGAPAMHYSGGSVGGGGGRAPAGGGQGKNSQNH
jgi:hypothetical protein